MSGSDSDDEGVDANANEHVFLPTETVAINLNRGRGSAGRNVLRARGGPRMTRSNRYAIVYGYQASDRDALRNPRVGDFAGACIIPGPSGSSMWAFGRADGPGGIPGKVMTTNKAMHAHGMIGEIVGPRTTGGFYAVLLNDGTVLFVHELYLMYDTAAREKYGWVPPPDNWFNRPDWWGPGRGSGGGMGGGGGGASGAGIAASRRRMAESLNSVNCWQPSSDELRRNQEVEEEELPLDQQQAVLYPGKITYLEDCNVGDFDDKIAEPLCKNSMDFNGMKCMWPGIGTSKCSSSTTKRFASDSDFDMLNANDIRYGCETDRLVGLRPLDESETCADISQASENICAQFYDTTKGIRCKYDSDNEICRYERPTDYTFASAGDTLQTPYSPYVCYAVSNKNEQETVPLASYDERSVGDDTKACNKLGNSLYNLGVCDYDTDNTLQKCVVCLNDEGQRSSDMDVYGPLLAMESDNCSKTPGGAIQRAKDINEFCQARTGEIMPPADPIDPVVPPVGPVPNTYNCGVLTDPVRCWAALPFGCHYWNGACRNTF